MQQWLTDIPLPMSPQERYIQGLDPNVDHPLHPQPLRVPARQARLGSIGEDDGQPLQHMMLAGPNKENVGHLAGWKHPLESKKRHNPEV